MIKAAHSLPSVGSVQKGYSTLGIFAEGHFLNALLRQLSCIFCRLIPSNNTVVLSDGDPVPAPPPGYESQPGFAITDDTQVLLPPPPPTSEQPTTSLLKKSHPITTQDNKCSTTEIESRL